MAQKRMRQMGIQMGILAACFFLLFFFYRLSHKQYTDYIPMTSFDKPDQKPEFKFDRPGIVEIEESRQRNGFMEVRVKPGKEGEVGASLLSPEGDQRWASTYYISPMGTVYNLTNGGFTGDSIFLVLCTAFFFIAAGAMFRSFYKSLAGDFYSYATIYSAGFSLFALDIGIVLLINTIDHIKNPSENPMFAVYSTIRAMSFHFMLVTTPLILVFSAAMFISNIELLRHERKRFRNVLGILVSILLVVGDLIGWIMYMGNYSGSWEEILMIDTLHSVYATAYVYFECMLIGAVICGIIAAKHQPAPDKDFCIILGCGFRKDGSLPPLLKGRVDRAIRFAAEQKEKTGLDLIFVPSGGQGPDEVMPEADAMKRYLLSQGIPEDRILKEDQSRNTYQNMAFSKKLIEERKKDAQVIYSTTNYHVFRSGVWASNAGLAAEGIGARTKWWFWPNAFVRECVGLLQNRWKQELVLFILLIAFFAVLSILLGV